MKKKKSTKMHTLPKTQTISMTELSSILTIKVIGYTTMPDPVLEISAYYLDPVENVSLFLFFVSAY